MVLVGGVVVAMVLVGVLKDCACAVGCVVVMVVLLVAIGPSGRPDLLLTTGVLVAVGGERWLWVAWW